MPMVIQKFALRAVATGILMAAFATAVQAQSSDVGGRITLDPDAPKAAPVSPRVVPAAPVEAKAAASDANANAKPQASPAPASAEVAAPAAGVVAKPVGDTLPVVYPASVEVKGRSVRLRSGPSEKYQVVKVLTEGDVLVATGVDKEWMGVRLPSDAPCWVSASFVADLGNGNGVIKGSRVNLRISPNTNHYPVGQVTDKQVRFVLDAEGKPRRNGDWIQIVPPVEARAWISVQYVKSSEVAVPADPMIAPQVAADAKPADAANGGGAVVAADASVAREVTPDEAAQIRNARLLDEAKAFRELDKLFLEEMSKPQDQRDFEEMKLLYSQYSESAEDKEIRARAVERVGLIAQTEAKIAAMISDANARADAAKAAVEQAEKDRLARIEELRKTAGGKPAEAVTWLVTGYVADHGRDAKVPASHALCDSDGNVLYYIRWDLGDLDAKWQLQVKIAGTVTEHAGWDKPVVVITAIEDAK